MAPYSDGGFMRYGIAIFLLAWLGGWAFGWISAFGSLFDTEGGASGFLIFWLVGWTVGGVFAMFFLYRILRPAVPERYIFDSTRLAYDSDLAPFTFSFDPRDQMDFWNKVFKKRTQKLILFGYVKPVVVTD
ncbi:MAG: hypothetical protein AAGA18_01170 [Verrucomicrobiota bacterium]